MKIQALVFALALACLTALPAAGYGQTSTDQQQAVPAQQPGQMPPHQGMMGGHQNFRAEYKQHYSALPMRRR
jgi:hypothetical protein